MEPQHAPTDCHDLDECTVTDLSAIDLTLIPLKQHLLSVHIPDGIQRRSFDSSTNTPSPNTYSTNHYRCKTVRKRRNSWPPSSTCKHLIVNAFVQSPPCAATPDIPTTNPLPVINPQHRPSLNRSTTQSFTRSILKEPRSPRSNSSRTVTFSEKRMKKELQVWYHINSPRRSKYPHLPSKSSHTILNTQFSTNFDDPNDFGPCHDPNPSYLGDYDYQHTDDANETLCQYMYCTLL